MRFQRGFIELAAILKMSFFLARSVPTKLPHCQVRPSWLVNKSLVARTKFQDSTMGDFPLAE